jgi:hypothetical protein
MQSRSLGTLTGTVALAGVMLACSSGESGTQTPGGSGAGGGAAAGSSSGGSGTGIGGLSAAAGGGAASVAGGGSGGLSNAGSPGAGGGGASAGSPAAGGGGSGGGSAGGGGGAAGGGSGGAATGMACPVDATFCSGFEDTALPNGAVYKVNAAPGEWTRDFAIDTSVMRGGKSSLRVKSGSDTGTSGSAYQMLAVPAPTGSFWARFYVRQADQDLGGVDHNVFAGASGSDEPNAAGMVEFAEDVGIAFNTSDDVRWPMGYGRINGNPMPFTLPKGMWHCIEISFDSATRAQKLYINGQLQIDASGYPASVAMPFKIFKFGFNKLHGPARSVWYDDVAVGPTRPGCL